MEKKPVTCCCSHDQKVETVWYRKPLYSTLAGTALLMVVSYLFPAMQAFRQEFFRYIHMLTWPILLGLVAGGMVDYFVPHEYISRHLAPGGKRTIFYATGLGFLMTVCSHGIMAMAMELHKKGASGPAVVSFILASPWASLPITFLLFGFFGVKAFAIVLSSVAVAIVTGLFFQALERSGWIENNQHTLDVPEGFSVRGDILKRFRSFHLSGASVWKMASGVGKGMIELVHMVFWWVILGALLASAVSVLVPHDFFHHYLGPDLRGLFATFGLAMVIEICSACTSPLGFEIYKQTGAFGNVFIFFMGGVITNYTQLGLVWSNLGKKSMLWLLSLAIPQVLLLGWLYNHIF